MKFGRPSQRYRATHPEPSEVVALRQFQSREDDIFIASFPKSGATLLQMMLYQLTTDGDDAFPHIHAVAPSLDEAVMAGEYEHLETLPSPRIFKTHLSWDLLKEHLADVRCIYIIRHPGDILLSARSHRMMTLGREIPLQEYIEHAYLTVSPYGTWPEHTRAWWPNRTLHNILPLSYENVVGNLPLAVHQIAEFLGLVLRARRPITRRDRSGDVEVTECDR